MSVDQAFPMGFGTPLASQGADYAVTTKQFPGYVAQPITGEPNGLYSVWREINGAQWCIQNADIGVAGFYIINPASPAWAFVQLAGGGFAQMTAPGNSQPGFTWTTTFQVNTSGQVIVGAGGPASIFYGTDFSAMSQWNFGTYQVTPPGNASSNTTALSTVLAALAASGGGIAAQPNAQGQGSAGTLLIPQYQYQVNASSGGVVVPSQTRIVAAGYGGRTGGGGSSAFFHFVINGSGSAGNSGFMFLNFNGGHTNGGSLAQNLAFNWASPTNSTDQAVNLNYWSAAIQQCTFKNCPVAVSFGPIPDGNGVTNNVTSLNGHMKECNVWISPGTVPNYSTSIWFTGTQGRISGPAEFAVNAPNTGTQLVCVSIGGGIQFAEHQVIEGIHSTGYHYAIDYADINNTGVGSGCQHTTIRDCELDGLNTVINCTLFKSASANVSGAIFDQHFAQNVFYKSPNSTNASPIVVVDTNNNTGSSPSLVLAVNFTDCVIYSNVQSAGQNTGVAQNNQYGIQLNGGSSIKIIGGKIGQVGGNNAPTGTANIAVTSSYTPAYVGCPSGGPGTGGYPNSGIPPTTGTPFASNTSGPDAVLIEGVDLRPTMGLANSGQPMGGNGAGGSGAALQIGNVGGGGNALTGTISVRNCDMSGYGGSGPLSLTGTTISAATITIYDCPGYNDQNTNIVGSGTLATLGNNTIVTAATATLLGGTSVKYFGRSIVQFLVGGSSVQFTCKGVQTTIPAGQFVTVTLNSPYDGFKFNTVANVASFAWNGF